MGATRRRSEGFRWRSTASRWAAWARPERAARRTRPWCARRSSGSWVDGERVGQGDQDQEEVLQGPATLQALPGGLQAPRADGLRRAAEQAALRRGREGAEEGAQGRARVELQPRGLLSHGYIW